MPLDDSVFVQKTPTPNFTDRKPQGIIIHYTAGSTDQSLKWLTTPDTVSAHYLITPEGVIHHMVEETKRAWHAGDAYWLGQSDINSQTIGIELVGYGYDDAHVPEDISRDDTKVVKGSPHKWFSYPDSQINALVELIQDIQSRYVVKPDMILGHSDIAPGRKVDPGPSFPWKKLYENHNIGAWPDVNASLKHTMIPQNVDTLWVQKLLRHYGYNCPITGTKDELTTSCLQAFQMHFRPGEISGQHDEETVKILAHMIEKYRYGII